MSKKKQQRVTTFEKLLPESDFSHKELTVNVDPRSPAQHEVVDLWPRSRVLFLIGPAGTGKAQPLTSTVWTPTGPKKMGDIKVGDFVCAVDGTETKVTGVYPQGKKKTFKVIFDNGDEVHCCGDHLWEVNKAESTTPQVKPVYQLLEEGIHTPKGRRKFYVDTPQALCFKVSDLPLDPYVLGLLLGDGCLVSTPRFSTADAELLQALINGLPEGVYVRHHQKIDYILTSGKGSKSNPLSAILKSLNLYGTKSHSKFIPKQYIYNSIESRIALFQGLMDTDGCSTYSAGVEYTSVSKQLAEDVRELAESLGAVVTMTRKKTTHVYKNERKFGECWRLYISWPTAFAPFRLKRKLDRYVPRLTKRRRWIAAIEEDTEEQCQCIAVEHNKHLYITDRCIPTHNTHISLALALSHALEISRGKGKETGKIMLSRPMITVDEPIGFLPGDVDEKVMPWLLPFHDVLGEMSFTKWEDLKKDVDVETVPIGMMRGRTIKNGTLICDEMQNASYEQIKCVLTRIGKGARIVISGDPDQSDCYSAKSSPLMQIARKLYKLDTVSVIKFDAVEDQMRDPLVSDMLALL